MNVRKTAVIISGAAVVIFSVACAVGYSGAVKRGGGEQKIHAALPADDKAKEVNGGAEALASEAPAEDEAVYCILANDAGLYMYRLSETGSELVAANNDIVLSLLPGSDRYRLANGIECESVEEAWSVWECFTS